MADRTAGSESWISEYSTQSPERPESTATTTSPQPQIKHEDGNVITNPPRLTDPGSSRGNAILLDDDDDEPQLSVKEEYGDEFPMSALQEIGKSKDDAIVIDDDVVEIVQPESPMEADSAKAARVDETNAPRSSAREVTVASHEDDVPEPQQDIQESQSMSAPAPAVSGPGLVNLGSSLLSTPARHPKERLLLAQQRLRERMTNPKSHPLVPSPAPAPQAAPVPIEDEEKLAAETYLREKADYEAKKAAGTNTFGDDITFYRLEGAERGRLKRLREEARYEQERDGQPAYESDDGLFVGGPESSRKRSFHPDSDNDGPPRRSAKPKKAAKRARVDSDEELRAALTGSTEKGKGKGAAKKASKAKGAKGKKGKKKDKRGQNENRLLDAGSLFTANVWNDAAGNENAPDQPTFTATRKDDALKKLIASVPEGDKKMAQVERKDLLDATRKFLGRGSVRADGQGGWKVYGMTSSLKNYQLLGAGFMRERERGADPPFGGISADMMGLGKTIMMIANIVNDKPEAGKPKTTLIVLPSGLVAQWASEFEKHVDSSKRKLQIIKYTSTSRIATHDTPGSLSTFDVVITTYHEVMASYPKSEVPVDLQTSEEKQAWWLDYYEQNKGDLHRVDWRRIVLDEAQAIKNHKSKTSLACRSLDAKYRWALSGTPILNTPLELYAYFKYLRVPYTGSYRIFKENYYGNNDSDRMERLQAMLQKFMIRRTHKDTMFGAPILKLPKASERTQSVVFNATEKAVYEIVRRRMISKINTFAKENTLSRNYSNVLVMLLRLRQLTGNLLLVEVVMRDLLEREDHEKIRELAELEALGDEDRRAQIIELRKLLAQSAATDAQTGMPEAEEEPPRRPDEASTSGPSAAPDLRDGEIGTGRHHGLKYDFGKYLKSLREGKKWEELQERTMCCSCRQPPEQPYVTSCYHIYCHPCLETVQTESALKGLARARCMECATEYSWTKACEDFTLDSIMSGADSENSGTEMPPVSRWKKKKDEDQLVKSWIDMHGTVLPSAKTIAIKAQVLNWMESNPDCKIIIYTQFIAMIRILKKVCEMENWTCTEYHGQMNVQSRDRAIEGFKRPGVSILLASLKCGGLGLNLTMANHVISVDPWWNSAVEQQAFCRVFRIGQELETSMTRFVVRGTIDEAMVRMQDRKQREIDQIMGDSVARRDRLSINDMMKLFGVVKEDENGKPFIIVEDKELLLRYNADSEDEGDEE